MSEQNTEPRRLYKLPTKGIVSGVCAGLAEYFNADPTIVRIVVLLIAIATGFVPTFIAYAIMSIITPEKPIF